MTTEMVSSITGDTLAEIEQAITEGTSTQEQALLLLQAVKSNQAPGRLPAGWATIHRGRVILCTLHKPRSPDDAGWPYYAKRGYSAPQPLYAGFPEVGARIARGLTERGRQIAQEGFNADNDDAYTDGQLLRAAASYLLKAAGIATLRVLVYWPWKHEWFKAEDQERCLDKGFALLCAELDRRDRSESLVKSESIE